MLEIIDMISVKDKYFRYKEYIKPNILSEETEVIFKDIEVYYRNNPTVSIIDWNKFRVWFKLYHPMFKKDKHKIFDTLFDNLITLACTTTSPDDEDLVKMFITRDYGTRIYLESGDVAEGIVHDLTSIEELIATYNNDIGKSAALASSVCPWDIEDIMAATSGSSGLAWRLQALNDTIGNINVGDLIVLTARPNAGKTTFLSSEATHMAQQLEEDKCVLWLNNEEAGSKVQAKILQSTSGISISDINKDRAAAIATYNATMGRENKIILVDKASISVTEALEAIKEYNPGLIIIDQLWKLRGFENLNETYRQTAIFNAARGWCKDYAPVIGTIQADGTAEGQKWIEQSQIYGSKTGVQGEADYIIAIGKTHEPGHINTRFIHTPKNKSQNDGVNRDLKSEVKFMPEVGRYENF